MNRSIVLSRAPTSCFFSAADEDMFLRTGLVNPTGTAPNTAKAEPPYRVEDSRMGRRIGYVRLHEAAAAK